MENGILPADLQTVIGTENIDFFAHSKRNQSKRKSLLFIGFGSLWTIFMSFCSFNFFFPLFLNGETEVTVDGVQTLAGWDNFEPLISLSVILGLFTLIGVASLVWGFYALFKTASYFVSTPTRLIRYQRGKINTYAWELFSGIEYVKRKNEDLSMQLRSGKRVGSKTSNTSFVHDFIYISEVPKILEIERICKKRIFKNTPRSVNTHQEVFAKPQG